MTWTQVIVTAVVATVGFWVLLLLGIVAGSWLVDTVIHHG